jgi:hypothetical protein
MDGTQQVTIKVWDGEDDHGDPSWGTPYDFKEVIVWSRTNDELERGGIPVEGWNVYIQPEKITTAKPIPKARDRVVYAGQEYAIEGRPLEYPLGGEMHILIVLKGVS